MSRNYSSTAVDTTLMAGVNGTDTTFTVGATTGFPAPPFALAVDAGKSTQEVVLVTGVSGTNLTVTRGYDSTVAQAHEAGAVVRHSHVGADFRDSRTHEAATTGVHGVSGSVVGTSGVQTLTGKSIALGSNTVTGTKAQFDTACTDANFMADPGKWSTWTPTLTGFTVSSSAAYYTQIGKTVHATYTATLSNVSTDELSVSLPVPPARTPAAYLPIGQAHGLDAGVSRYTGQALLATGTAGLLKFFSNNSAVAWGLSAPFAWGLNDQLSFSITYEAD